MKLKNLKSVIENFQAPTPQEKAGVPIRSYNRVLQMIQKTSEPYIKDVIVPELKNMPKPPTKPTTAENVRFWTTLAVNVFNKGSMTTEAGTKSYGVIFRKEKE